MGNKHTFVNVSAYSMPSSWRERLICVFHGERERERERETKRERERDKERERERESERQRVSWCLVDWLNTCT